MSDFTFTETTKCEHCGLQMGSSDQQCDHNGETVQTHVFRWLKSNDIVSIDATDSYKWHALRRENDDWIGYQWIGPRCFVEQEIERGWHEEYAEFSTLAVSTDRIKTD